MEKRKRHALDKLNTLLWGKDLRITKGEPYTEVRPFDFSSYYPVEDYIKSQRIPSENCYDIKHYGAVAGDTGIDNAPYINQAIQDAEKTGGTVLISGGDFTSGTIYLRSNVTLYIEKNSSVSANPTGEGYPKRAILYGENVENVTLTGGGKIQGNGHLFGRKPLYDCNITEPSPYIDVIEMRKSYRAQLRFAHPSKYGGPVILKQCKNINIFNFMIENSAFWTLKLENCDDVDIYDLVINNNRNVANADGLDISGSSNVTVNHCFISTADDGICLKNAVWIGNQGPMNNIRISDCEIISRTNAIKIGTETTFDIRDVVIESCKLMMTDLYPGSVSGISIEACDGSVVRDIHIRNIVMDRCTCPLFIRLGNRNRAAQVTEQSANAIEFSKKAELGRSADQSLFDMKSDIMNITVENIVATDVELPVILAGFRQRRIVKRIKNVTLKNFDLTYSDIPETVDRRLFIPEYVKVYPECWRFRNLPAYALWARHVENLTLKNFQCNHPLKTWKDDIIQKDVV